MFVEKWLNMKLIDKFFTNNWKLASFFTWDCSISACSSFRMCSRRRNLFFLSNFSSLLEKSRNCKNHFSCFKIEKSVFNFRAKIVPCGRSNCSWKSWDVGEKVSPFEASESHKNPSCKRDKCFIINWINLKWHETWKIAARKKFDCSIWSSHDSFINSSRNIQRRGRRRVRWCNGHSNLSATIIAWELNPPYNFSASFSLSKFGWRALPADCNSISSCQESKLKKKKSESAAEQKNFQLLHSIPDDCEVCGEKVIEKSRKKTLQ